MFQGAAQVMRQAAHEIAPKTSPPQRLHARHRLGQAAGNDEIEHIEVDVDIEGEAMPRNAPPHGDTDCRNLARRRPDAGQACSHKDLQPLIDESTRKRYLEAAQESSGS